MNISRWLIQIKKYPHEQVCGTPEGQDNTSRLFLQPETENGKQRDESRDSVSNPIYSSRGGQGISTSSK